MSTTAYQQFREFTAVLQQVEDKAFRLGLIKTSHALNEAKNTCGWEQAEIHEGRHPTKVHPINGMIIPAGGKTK